MRFRRLKDLREDHDLLQKDVAALLNCSQACYARYESGERELPLEALIRLSRLYQVSTDYILDLTNNPNHK